MSLSFGRAIQISSYISPILSEKLTKSYNEIYTFREIENAHISLGVLKKSKIALPPSMAFTFFFASGLGGVHNFNFFNPSSARMLFSHPKSSLVSGLVFGILCLVVVLLCLVSDLLSWL